MLQRYETEKEKTCHMNIGGRKFEMNDAKHFDLQYTTPIVRSHFSGQLLRSHYPGRK